MYTKGTGPPPPPPPARRRARLHLRCPLVLAGHPFDTIKVRLQAEGTLSTRFQGPLHCVRETLAHEGVRGLYKGMAAFLRVVT